jgi:hypothetical protein
LGERSLFCKAIVGVAGIHNEGDSIMLRSIILGLAFLTASATLAQAGNHSPNYCPPAVQYRWITEYRQVTCYENREVAYNVCVTRYDHCGNPVQVYETRYRTVRVPVTTTVPVRVRVAYVP